MLQATHPQAILVIHLHRRSPCRHRAGRSPPHRRHGRKALATTVEDAVAIQHLSEKYNVPVLTNYETTWYNSNTAAANILSEGKIGDLRKLVVHDGHEGPKEIGVSPAFFAWLTDPKQNGRRRPLRLRLLRRSTSPPGSCTATSPSPSAPSPSTSSPRSIPTSKTTAPSSSLTPLPGHHPGLMELALRPQGHGDLRRHRLRPTPSTTTKTPAPSSASASTASPPSTSRPPPHSLRPRTAL